MTNRWKFDPGGSYRTMFVRTKGSVLFDKSFLMVPGSTDMCSKNSVSVTNDRLSECSPVNIDSRLSTFAITKRFLDVADGAIFVTILYLIT